MTARPRQATRVLPWLAGPAVWALHFFAVYLAEAFLCVSPDAAATRQIQFIGIGLTVVAIAGLIVIRRRPWPSDPGSYTRSLADLSIVAVVWTAVPLLMLQACVPATP